MNRTTIYIIASICVILFITSLSSPKESNLAVHLAIFSAIFTFVYFVTRFILELSFKSLNTNKKMFVSSVMAIVCLAIISISTFTTISLTDILLLVGTTVLAIWYGTRGGE